MKLALKINTNKTEVINNKYIEIELHLHQLKI